MDISRRKVFGLVAGAAGGASLASCGANSTGANETQISPVGVTFDHGVASGDAVQTRVILWTRVTPKSDTSDQIAVTCLISETQEKIENGEGDQSVVAITSKARDFTVKVDAGAAKTLKADTKYFYRFGVNTASGMVWSPIGETRTLPATGGDKLRFAVVSCSNFPFGYFNVYKALAERDDLDAVMHLGDYFYEYGIDGYGAEAGEKLGRRHDPVTETVTLEDYRLRHAQYKSDPDLQAAHAICPWYCTWDDHESTNNSYRTGAQNHNPENGEGDWTERKQVAVQAYLEWMPVRDPQAGLASESIYRSADFGDLASFFMLESRLTGRSEEISWFTELDGVEPQGIPAKAMATMGRVADPTRTMLGQVQEAWLNKGLKASTDKGVTWQVLVNQVIMASVRPPKFMEILKPEELTAMPEGYAQLLVQFSQLGLPQNLDAWDGFPAARERLFAAAKETGARLITVTGDTHTAWANEPHAMDGSQMGVEFGCTAVTSPGLGSYIPLENLGELYSEANEDVAWFDPFGNGFTLVTLTPEKAQADFFKVSTVLEKNFTTEKVASFESTPIEGGMSPLKRV